MKVTLITLFLIFSFSVSSQTVRGLKKKASFEIEKGNFNKAIRFLNQAIKITPNDNILYETRAYCYENTNNTALAIKDNLKILKFDKSGNIHLRLGFELINLEKYKEAREYLKKAISIQPNELSARYNYALTYQRVEEYDSAINIYDEILKLDNLYIPALVSKSRCLLLLGEIDKSKEIVDKFFMDKLFNTEMLMIRAEINERQGFLEKSLSDYSRAISILPNDYDLLNRYASVLGELGLYNEESVIRQRIINLYKEDNVATESISAQYGLLAISQLKSSSFKDAEESLNLSIMQNKNDGSLYFYRSIAKAKLKAFESACEDLNKANVLNPEMADEHNKYFEDEIEFGDFQKICFSIP